MKSGIRNNKTLKLVGATSVTLFSLVSVFAASIAWFSMNKNVNNNGAEMNVKLFDRRFGKMTLHKYLGTTGTGSNAKYQFNRSPSGTFTYSYSTDETVYTPADLDDTDSSYMGEFSLNNPRHPFLALIQYSKTYVTGPGTDEISVVASTSNPFICATNEDGEFLLGLDEDSNPLSSVVKFAGSSYETLSANQGTATVEGVNYNSYDFSVPTTWDHFAEITVDADENYSFDNDTGWTKDKDIIRINDGSKVQYVAIIFDYYDEALAYIYNKYLGSPVLEQEHVPFDCDWKLII